MTIVSTGRNRTAISAASTWSWFMIGTGTATVALGDSDLASAVTSARFAIVNATVINNVVTLIGFLSPSQGNSASSITELGFMDDPTAGNLLFRSVASTVTWTAFIKDSTKSALIQVDVTFSS